MPGWHISSGGGGAGGGTGDVVGPAASVDGQIAVFDGVTGKLLKVTAATFTAAGSLTIPSAETIEFSTDAGISRVGAGSLKLTDGGAGYGGLIFKDGTKAATAISWTGSGVDTGFFSRAANYTMIASDGKEIGYFRWSGNSYDPGLTIVGGVAISGAELDGTAPTVGIYRAADGVARIAGANDNGSISKLLNAVLVEANTAGSGAPNIIAANESGTCYTNEAATAKNYESLPTAAAGYRFRFCCQDADGIRITAAGGDTIRVIDKVTAAAGYIESTTIGSVVLLEAINATEWFAMSIHGVWTDGTFTYDDTSLTTP